MPAFTHFNAFAFAQFGIPAPASVAFTYVDDGVADDDLVETVTYKNASDETIGVLEMTYVEGTNNIATITRTE